MLNNNINSKYFLLCFSRKYATNLAYLREVLPRPEVIGVSRIYATFLAYLRELQFTNARNISRTYANFLAYLRELQHTKSCTRLIVLGYQYIALILFI